MTVSKTIQIEFSINEARILSRAVQHYSPPKEDEMISAMIYLRILKKIEENVS